MLRLSGLMVLVLVVASGATVILNQRHLLMCGLEEDVNYDEDLRTFCKTASKEIELWLLGEKENPYKDLINMKQAFRVLVVNGHKKAKEIYDYMENYSWDCNERSDKFGELLQSPFSEDSKSCLADRFQQEILSQFEQDCNGLQELLPRLRDVISKLRTELKPKQLKALADLYEYVMNDCSDCHPPSDFPNHTKDLFNWARHRQPDMIYAHGFKLNDVINGACKHVNSKFDDKDRFYLREGKVKADIWVAYMVLCMGQSSPE